MTNRVRFVRKNQNMFIKCFSYLPWENLKIPVAFWGHHDVFRIQDSTCTLLFISGDNMRRKISAFQVKHRVLSMIPTTWTWFFHAHYFEIAHVGPEHSEMKSLALGVCGLAKILLWSRQASVWRQRSRLLMTNRRDDLSNYYREGGGCVDGNWRKRETIFSHFSFDGELTMRNARFVVLVQFIPLSTAAHVGFLSRMAKVLTTISPQWVTFIFSWRGSKGEKQTMLTWK